jgi:hypothetical protein
MIIDPDAGLPRVRILGDFHRTQRAGAVLTVYQRQATPFAGMQACRSRKARGLVTGETGHPRPPPPVISPTRDRPTTPVTAIISIRQSSAVHLLTDGRCYTGTEGPSRPPKYSPLRAPNAGITVRGSTRLAPHLPGLGRALSWHVRLLGSIIDAKKDALVHVDDLSDGRHENEPPQFSGVDHSSDYQHNNN